MKGVIYIDHTKRNMHCSNSASYMHLLSCHPLHPSPPLAAVHLHLIPNAVESDRSSMTPKSWDIVASWLSWIVVALLSSLVVVRSRNCPGRHCAIIVKPCPWCCHIVIARWRRPVLSSTRRRIVSLWWQRTNRSLFVVATSLLAPGVLCDYRNGGWVVVFT